MDAENRIASIADLLVLLSNQVIGRELGVRDRFWYSGQGTAGLPLKPGVYRDTFVTSGTSEEDRLRKE